MKYLVAYFSTFPTGTRTGRGFVTFDGPITEKQILEVEKALAQKVGAVEVGVQSIQPLEG